MLRNRYLKSKYLILFKFSLIDKLIMNKKQFIVELQSLESLTDQLRDILTPIQTAKYLV
jgi:hypothetical protein